MTPLRWSWSGWSRGCVNLSLRRCSRSVHSHLTSSWRTSSSIDPIDRSLASLSWTQWAYLLRGSAFNALVTFEDSWVLSAQSCWSRGMLGMDECDSWFWNCADCWVSWGSRSSRGNTGSLNFGFSSCNRFQIICSCFFFENLMDIGWNSGFVHGNWGL